MPAPTEQQEQEAVIQWAHTERRIARQGDGGAA
jgi:hypothetical protein